MILKLKEQMERELVVAEAKSWKGTPFVWEACIKGLGVDCARFLGGVFNAAGVKKIDLNRSLGLPPTWFLHRLDGAPSPLLEAVNLYAVEYGPEQPHNPGDVLLVKMARDWAHSAIVVEWPCIIACLSGFCVTEYPDIRHAPQYGTRPMKFLNPWHPQAGGNV